MNQSIKKFKQGDQYVNIAAAVTKNELTTIVKILPTNNELTKIKFTPASKVATRMFKHLYTYLDDQITNNFVDQFFNHLEEFAFYDELSRSADFEKLDKNKVEGRVVIIQNLLNNEMIYGDLPKALIEFHRYENQTTTPIDEQIYDGEQYLNSDPVNLHFTIAEEDKTLFNEYVTNVINGKDYIDITYSFQKKHTHTMAVDLDNKPFHLENGEILYHPGGHGSLLDNLNDLEEDIVFIKNIDNVSHRSQIEETIEAKNMLTSIGLEVKQQIEAFIVDLISDEYNLVEIKAFIKETLNITLKNEMRKDRAIEFLNLPLRVVGVVKNKGEPGGGTYIVDNGGLL